MGGYFDFGGIYMFPIVSVIVPVYNSEKYLTEALNSLEEQTFKNFEVIIVNDGSTDNSEKIIKDFVNKNSNFKLINQKNMGPGYAKNTGIRYSKGKYIAFLDSDDFFAPNFLEILYNLAVENKADIAFSELCPLFFLQLGHLGSKKLIASARRIVQKAEDVQKS